MKALRALINQTWMLTIALLCVITPNAHAILVDADDISKEWRNAVTISHPYAANLNYGHEALNLSSSPEDDDAYFEIIARSKMVDEQPHRILWTMEMDNDSKFFRLKNLKNDSYLVREAGTSHVVLNHTITEDDPDTFWFIQSISPSGDYAIFSASGEQDHALVIPKQTAIGADKKVSIALGTLNDYNNTDHFFRIDSRFLEVALTPYDIENGTCLVRLANGAPMEGFLTPSPAAGQNHSITRGFRINIMGFGNTSGFEFAESLDFDPLAESTTLTGAQNDALAAMYAQVVDMKVVLELDLDPKEVFDSFMQQLSDAYYHENDATMMYFPESLAAYEADYDAGKVEKRFELLADKSLAYTMTIHKAISEGYSFVFFVKRTNKVTGVSEYFLVDPADTTSPSRPRPD